MGKDTKELLPSITIFVLFHAFFAFFGKLMLGHITFLIIPIAVMASLVGSKLGVITSRKLSSQILNKLLSCILILGLIKIIYELFI